MGSVFQAVSNYCEVVNKSSQRKLHQSYLPVHFSYNFRQLCIWKMPKYILKSLWTYQNVIVSEKFFTNKQPGGPSSRPTQHEKKGFFFFTKIHVNFLKNCVNFSNKNYHRFSSKITWTQAQTACHVIFVENLWFFLFEKSHDFFENI